MPITYEIRNEGRFVHTQAAGEVTEDDLLNYQAAVLSDARVKPGFNEFFDGTAARGASLSQAVLEKMIAVDRNNGEKLRGGKCAVVVRNEFDLAETFERLHGGPHQVMVFFNLDVAWAWLGETAKGTSPA